MTCRSYVAECHFTVPHTELLCTAAPGVGAGHTWQVSVGGVESEPSEDSVAYAPPQLSSVAGPGAQLAETRGGALVVLTGVHFGPAGPANLDIVTYGPTATEITAESCTVSIPGTQITCLTAEGTGTGHSWVLSVGGQSSEVLHANTGYAAPIVSHFSGVGAKDGDTRGMELVAIHGFNFGNSLQALGTVTYTLADGTSFNATSCTLVEPHEAMECLSAAGAGAALSWEVVIDGQVSRNPVTSYHAPVINRLVCLDQPGGLCGALPTDVGSRVAIIGDYFGPPDGQVPFLSAVSFGPTGYEYRVADFEVVDHTRIECVTVPAMGSGMRWRVTVGGQTSAASEATVSTAPPTLHGMSPDAGPTDTGTTVTLLGSNWAVRDPRASIHVLFGNPNDHTLRAPVRVIDADVDEASVVAGGDRSLNASKATFQVPPGVGMSRALRLQVSVTYDAVGASLAAPAFTVVTEPVMFSYLAPSLEFVEVSSKFEQSDAESAFVSARWVGRVAGCARVHMALLHPRLSVLVCACAASLRMC